MCTFAKIGEIDLTGIFYLYIENKIREYEMAFIKYDILKIKLGNMKWILCFTYNLLFL